MLRRLSILGVLLLSLSGFVPAALACALMAQQMDCCPPDHSCETDPGPAWTDDAGLSCCDDALSSRSPAVVAKSVEIAKQSSQDLPPPDFPGAHPGCVASRGPPESSRDHVSSAVFSSGQQDLYLQTGRLRL